MLKRFLLLLLIFCTIGAFAQTGSKCNFTLKGYIKDEHDDLPLSFAIIFIKGTKSGTTANDKGYFELNICEGVQTVTVQHFDCDTKDIVFNISKDSSVIIYLEHHENTLHEVEIKAHKHDEKNTISQEIINNAELLKKQGFSLSEMLQSATGIQLLQNGNNISKPVLHGMHSNRLPIISNGLRLEGQNWGNEHAPEIDAFSIEEVKVLKGAMGLRYGMNAIAGAIVLEAKPFADTASWQIGLQTTAASNGRSIAQSGFLAFVFPKKSNLAVRLQGTYKRSGNQQSPDYFIENSGLKELNYSAQIQYKYKQAKWNFISTRYNSDIAIFTGSHIGNISDLENAISLNRPNTPSYFSYDIKRPFQQVLHEVLKLNYYQKISSFHKLNLNISRQYNRRYEFDAHTALNDSIAGLNRAEFRMQLETYNAELFWEHKLHRNINGQMGANVALQRNITGGLRSFLPAFNSSNAGFWLVERFLNEKYEIEGGLRYDFKNTDFEVYIPLRNDVNKEQRTFSGFSGNLGFIYKGFHHSKITYNIGTAWRAPDANELFANGVHHGTASVEIGNAGMKEEKAWNQGLSYEGSFAKWDFKIDAYLNFISNYMYLKPQKPPTLSIRGAFPTFYYTQHDVLFYGSDIKIQYHFTPLMMLTQKANLLRVQNLDSDEFIDRIAPNSIETMLSKNFNRIQYLNEAAINISLTTMFKQHRYNKENDYKTSPPTYALLNFSFEFHPTFLKQKLDLNIGANNILNTRYRNYLDNMRYYTDAIGRNIYIQMRYIFQQKL